MSHSCDEYERLPPVWQPLLRVTDLHPRYNSVFQRTISTLFYEPSNLPKSLRHFIAVMAAYRHRCHYLVDLHAREFERLGGDALWLRGLEYVKDKRVHALDRINRMLAHRPWLVNAQDIMSLVTTQNIAHWSLSDLAYASVILSHTHALSSFIHAVGQNTVQPTAVSRSELQSMVTRFEWAVRDKENEGDKRGEVEELLQRMSKLRAVANTDNVQMNVSIFDALSNDITDSGSGSESPDRSSDSREFSKDLAFAYVDFAKREDSTKTFKIHEFTWDHAFNILEEQVQCVAEALDAKFVCTQELTYKFMGGFEDVDTTGYRTAIWNYIQALFGIRHDDYEYSAVNQLLSREMKTFVKTVACHPHRMTDELRSAVMTEFKNSEKVHVVMMILEARLQAAMLWLTRAMANYRTLRSSMTSRELD